MLCGFWVEGLELVDLEISSMAMGWWAVFGLDDGLDERLDWS